MIINPDIRKITNEDGETVLETKRNTNSSKYTWKAANSTFNEATLKNSNNEDVVVSGDDASDVFKNETDSSLKKQKEDVLAQVNTILFSWSNTPSKTNDKYACCIEKLAEIPVGGIDAVRLSLTAAEALPFGSGEAAAKPLRKN